MVKYIISKALEISECTYDSEDIGVFDTEEEAVQKAANYYVEMPEHERQYYEILVWRVSGSQLDPDDWDTVEEGETVAEFRAHTYRDEDECWSEDWSTEEYDPELTVHYCIPPEEDSVRVWIGMDSDRYVDIVCTGGAFDSARALAAWFEQYGEFLKEDWQEKFPETNRRRYFRQIAAQGYSCEEAEKILQYLPQTISVLVSDNVVKMIDLWKAKARVINPYRTPEWKKAILENREDVWTEVIRPPYMK